MPIISFVFFMFKVTNWISALFLGFSFKRSLLYFYVYILSSYTSLKPMPLFETIAAMVDSTSIYICSLKFPLTSTALSVHFQTIDAHY